MQKLHVSLRILQIKQLESSIKCVFQFKAAMTFINGELCSVQWSFVLRSVFSDARKLSLINICKQTCNFKSHLKNAFYTKQILLRIISF
jgi:hypothetical protein